MPPSTEKRPSSLYSVKDSDAVGSERESGEAVCFSASSMISSFPNVSPTPYRYSFSRARVYGARILSKLISSASTSSSRNSPR